MLSSLIDFLTTTMAGVTAGKAHDRGPQFVARVSIVVAVLIALVLAFGVYLVVSGRAG